MKRRTMFSSKEAGDKYLNYLVVWTDLLEQKHSEAHHTRKGAENSRAYLSGCAVIYTRKQFERLA